MARKACKTCRRFVEGETCPNCKNNQFSENWKGRIYINDPNNSVVAQRLGITMKGEYAIKVR